MVFLSITIGNKMAIVWMKNHTGQLKAHLPKEYALLSLFLEEAIGEAMTPCRMILEALHLSHHEHHMNTLHFSTQTMQYTLEIHLQEVMLKKRPKQADRPTPSYLLLEHALLKRVIQSWLDQLEMDQLGIITGALDREA
jgi:uncharacterized protein YacL (UPF0231 family)